LYQKEIKYIYLKNDRALRAKFDNVEDDYLDIKPENSPSNLIIENGINFHIDWQKGQKTGFFLDQRENRKLLLGYCYNRKVLNCFSYSGGFSLYALTGGASHVESVDISGTALELLNKNVNCNPFQGTHLSHQSDVMQFLKSQPDASWDLIVVDPPAFAKNISKKHNAVIAYKRLNALALKKIKPGGILFTFSCSQVVNTELFYNTITAASIESQRNIRVLHKLMQGPDHPINIFHPEGSYLKGLVLYVE
jgi:23S rRNA (cytosine1962-C5)-methyltransferase